ncbi:MAG: DUF6078 family protein [Bacteroides sp.]
MKKESDNLSAPYNFARCITNQCPQAKSCLHRLVALNDTTKEAIISIINPICIPTDEPCPYYLSNQKVPVAWGITHLFDDIPHKNVQELKKQMLSHFGRTKYYCFYRKETCLTPEDQDYIRQLFQQKDIREDLSFDFYSEEYKWT